MMEITLTPPQSEVFMNPSRFKVIAAGRRWGKTVVSIYSLIDAAAIPDSNVWYVTSSYRACKMIAWEPLKELVIGSGWADRINESDLSIKLKNRSRIVLRGADNYDSLRGTSIHRLVLDECAFLDQRVFTQALRPTLSDSGGGAIFISSPTGRDWFYDLWLKGQDGPHKEEGWKSWQYTTLEGGNVPKEEVEAARRDLDEKTFNQEYNAAFVDYHGLVYYNYDRVTSVRDQKYNKNRTLYLGLDFNISPMCAVIAQKEGDEMFIIDEIVLYSSNTDEMADEIRSRYPVENCIIYPDPASKQRKTSAGGKTDYSILQNYGFRVRVRNSHPFVRDRINAVNSRLKNSDGERKLFIHSKCRYLLESLEKMSYKEGTSIPEKGKYDHATDALGYLCEYLHPVRRTGGPISTMRLSGL